MMFDQVVAALVAEGYGSESVRTAMDLLAEEDWREEDDDWNNGDLRALRKRLGTPAADRPGQPPTGGPDPVLTAGDDPPAEPQDPRYDTDVWAADLARVFDRTTGGSVPLAPDQIRRVADHLLHQSSGLWDPETGRPRTQDGSYVPDFTVDRWADGIHESLHAATDGRIEVSRVELQVTANLLLHAQEGDWVPQAALLRAEHQPREAETS